MANRAIKFRAYPNKDQQVLFAKTFGSCRFVWNLMLEEKITYYEKHEKMLSITPAKYKAVHTFLKEVDSLALANVQLNLQGGFTNFFKGNLRFPQYKSKKTARRSYTTNNQKGTIDIENGKIRLPKVGWVNCKIHREPKNNWVIKSATVSQDSDGKYYISVLFEFDEVITPVIPQAVLGLDYSSHALYVDSDGYRPTYGKPYQKNERKLTRLQRGRSRKQRNSHNCEKARQREAKLNKKIANQRLDFLHKQSRKIANSVDVVVVEDLDLREVSKQTKTLKLGKFTHDNGFGIFRNLLEYKLLEQGKYFIKVNKWYPSSQICHCCGSRNSKIKDLSIRTWDCPDCGATHDRDVNAAINLRNEGWRILKEAA
ncbi:putative transposase [Lachnospiraceae bacterium PF1-22]